MDSLASYAVMDSEPEADYEALTRLAAEVCDTPFAGVSLIDHDRQWFKSVHGMRLEQIQRAEAICNDVVADETPLAVEDTKSHPRYRLLPHVWNYPHVRSYAGVPLIGRDGLPLGSLFVMDQQARSFTGHQLNTLTVLARQVVILLEQRRRDARDGLLDGAVAASTRNPLRLRRALEDSELVPHFQPLVDLHSGLASSMEALIRWEHPQAGTLPPSTFLPVVESSALVVPLGRLVLDASLQQLRTLDAQGIRLPGGVSVNVASGQLTRPGLARDVLQALERHAVEPGRLSLEITETTRLPAPDLARRELGELAEAGVHVVVDDYGVGWSNLRRVLQLPVDGIKLDRSIAAAVLDDPQAATMAAATVAMARDLGIGVVAEGIETGPVRDHLRDLGCRTGQGWLFGAAVPGPALPAALTTR